MNHESYSKISKNMNSLTVATKRAEQADILTEVLKLLSKQGSNYDACLKLLSHGYYNWLPDYFFDRPASSSGKYHPTFANTAHGLMLHSLAVVRLADMMFGIYDENQYNDNIHNVVISAAWYHDMFKYGDPDEYTPGKFTVHEHPVLAAQFFKDPDVIMFCHNEFNLSQDDTNLISALIATHMGPFTTNKYSQVVLGTPQTSLQRLLHVADYLASRKENDVVKDVM